MKTTILSWLLHHANRNGRNEHFYKIKNELLTRFGTFVTYDVQFIEGKKCHACGGTGIYHGFSEYSGRTWTDTCNRCYGGWYKRPTWNILKRIQFGKYQFHQPYERSYKDPKISQIIEGYIEHRATQYSNMALHILCLLYEPGYLSRWYKAAGNGWYCYWYYPSNWVQNIIHLWKNGRSAMPFHGTRFYKPKKYEAAHISETAFD